MVNLEAGSRRCRAALAAVVVCGRTSVKFPRILISAVFAAAIVEESAGGFVRRDPHYLEILRQAADYMVPRLPEVFPRIRHQRNHADSQEQRWLLPILRFIVHSERSSLADTNPLRISAAAFRDNSAQGTRSTRSVSPTEGIPSRL